MSLDKIRINARHSDLARLQAYRVGDALRAKFPSLEIVYSFRASLGDQNQSDPLWKMPEKGVFTEDFVRDLADGSADIVVHSWKDLPTEPRPGLTIAATLPRADQRDLLLFKSAAPSRLRIMTSSPRRAYNLDSFFREYLPFKVDDVVFENIRGNIPTRIKKFLESDCDGLIVAKAAIDRLLEATETEFSDVRSVVLSALKQTQQMVLPLSLNPTAAAQGALAVEIRADRTDLGEMLAEIHHLPTFAAVVRERDILASYGGGCHQKIGVSVLDRAYGRITYLQGLTDAGETLNTKSLETVEPMPRAIDEAAIFPRAGEESPFFTRAPLPRGIWSGAERSLFLFVARDRAWPESFRANEKAMVVTAGLKTWKKLAERGVWVSGSTESLGESEVSAFTTLARGRTCVENDLGAPPEWTKLTHDIAARDGAGPVATYSLTPAATAPSLEGRTHFYWMSGTAFDRAVDLNPWLLKAGVHASGPGHTHDHLRQKLSQTPFVYLSVEQFRRAALSL